MIIRSHCEYPIALGEKCYNPVVDNVELKINGILHIMRVCKVHKELSKFNMDKLINMANFAGLDGVLEGVFEIKSENNNFNIIQVHGCGFPNPYMGEEEKFCPNNAVDIFEADVEENKFVSYICQHHINTLHIMYDNKKLGRMIRQGDIRGEWLL